MRSMRRYRPSTVPASMGSLPMRVFRTLAVMGAFAKCATAYHENCKAATPTPPNSLAQHYFRRIGFAGDGMPKSLSNARARQELLDRLERLTPEATPRWGTLTAPQMLAHLADWMLMAKGELKVALRNRPQRYPPLKQLLIYWLPFPKGYDITGAYWQETSEWDTERTAVRRHVQSFEN